MIKGFIEVKANDKYPRLVNVRKIKNVVGNCIYFSDNTCLSCKESYPEIKQKIEEAKVTCEN